jgi:SAM-dependent methyltransferase
MQIVSDRVAEDMRAATRRGSGVDAAFYPETGAGGFTRHDGSVEFHGRVNALVGPQTTVLDLGAGRGKFLEDACRYRRDLMTLKGKARRVIGVDVDAAVLGNPALDEAHVYDGRRLPLADRSVDLIVSDWVLEHIADAPAFCAEVARVLTPGGWLCARTPNLFSLLVLASSALPNKSHPGLLTRIQPDRQERDVFPTRYRLNSMAAIARAFPAEGWRNCSYTWSPEPAYHFNSRAVYRLMQVYQYLKRPILGGECLHIFLQKRR